MGAMCFVNVTGSRPGVWATVTPGAASAAVTVTANHTAPRLLLMAFTTVSFDQLLVVSSV